MSITMEHLKHHITQFKNKASAENSIITLAGTGPNGASHVGVLQELSLDYLRQVNKVNIISASSFSFMIYLAHCQGDLNINSFLNYDSLIRDKHSSSLGKVIKHILKGNISNRNIYPNDLIGEAITMLFGERFSNTRIDEVDLPLSFYAYCEKNNKVIDISRETFPEMTFMEIGRTCVSIPAIHGAYQYQDYQFIDPIFSPLFSKLRRHLFKNPNSQLYVNYKQTKDSGKVYFVQPEHKVFPEITLMTDFLKFYTGVPNKNINKTHRLLIEGWL